MQTRLAAFIRDTPEGREADAILRACVHCGFCNATCPTYQLLGDELDGPRGRLYLMKLMFEGESVSAGTRLHLDRCLTCRSCETTCPSGVRYGRLLDLGRHTVERLVPRPALERLTRWALRRFLLTPLLVRPTVWLGRLAGRLPAASASTRRPSTRHARKVVLLQGCVQPALDAGIDAALARVLDRLGIEVVRAGQAGCCGALSHHLDAIDEARVLMRRNLDAWWPLIEVGAEAVLASASGCGLHLRDYGRLLADDPVYAERAMRFSARVRDPVELLADADLSAFRLPAPRRIVFQSPCTLQHGRGLRGVVEGLLGKLGYDLVPVVDSHLCCGAAGTYSILQSGIATELRDRKLDALTAGDPELIATANIGCQVHLATATELPVVHWITLLDNAAIKT